MKYLKLYESFNNNIEDLKWIMIEMTENQKLFGHEKDDCFLYEISNMPSEEDLESAKGRLEDLGYNIVYIGKPKIENSGKTYDVKDLKERVKKAKDMAKKNENKVYIKKSKINPIIKTINSDKERVQNINDDTKVQFISFNIRIYW